MSELERDADYDPEVHLVQTVWKGPGYHWHLGVDLRGAVVADVSARLELGGFHRRQPRTRAPSFRRVVGSDRNRG